VGKQPNERIDHFLNPSGLKLSTPR